LAISSAVGYLFPWMGVVSVAFLLVRWFGLVLVRFLSPRFFRSCRLALSSGAIRQTPLSRRERRGTDYGKGHGDDHDAGDGHDAGDNHDADPFLGLSHGHHMAITTKFLAIKFLAIKFLAIMSQPCDINTPAFTVYF
jgi:hypothetical protein